MPRDNKNEKNASRATSTRTYWARTESPRPWFPWGVAQLLGIGVLFIFGALILAPRIEADVRTQVSDRLHSAGVVSAVVSSNGQEVSVRASASETNKMVVQTIAGSTRCQTWAGQLECPTAVSVQLDQSLQNSEIDARPSMDWARCNETFKTTLAATSIQFETGSAVIDEGSEGLLEQLTAIASACPGTLTVEGHTDSQGSSEMNKLLSQARAESVLKELVRLGVNPKRLSAMGYGEQQPLAGNDTADGRAKNRRIVIKAQIDN